MRENDLNKKYLWQENVMDEYILENHQEFKEAIYDGMIGIMELTRFMKVANEKQKETLKKFIDKKEYRKVWELVSNVLNIDIPVERMNKRKSDESG